MRYPLGVTLKILLVKLAQSPLDTLVEIGRRLLPARDNFPQVKEMREVVRNTPLVIEVETTNICNAACAFCAYPKMERKKGVMSMPLFRQIVDEYAAMGGGLVSLTPMAGDVLLDPHLLERLEILATCPRIPQISFTTNGIAFHRYQDEQVMRILELTDYIQLSIGGLDAQTYQELYGVDGFDQVEKAMDRLLLLNASASRPAKILFAFRTNDWRFELRYRKKLQEYRRRGAYISHIWTYANYAGLLRADNDKALEVSRAKAEKGQTCIYAAVHMAISWDGKITACGCTDFEVRELRIGQVGETPLSHVWTGDRRKRILESFGRNQLFRICRECSAYKSDAAIFSSSMCSGIKPHGPLPEKYFHLFWGG